MPEVHTSATGRPEAFARPRAKNAALRSSVMVNASMHSFMANAMVRGVEREPGEMQTDSTPPRRNHSVLRLARSLQRLIVGQACRRLGIYSAARAASSG